MKEHIMAKMINDLRDISIKYHDHDCLREVIRTTVLQAIHDDEEWARQYKLSQQGRGYCDDPARGY